MLGNHDEISKSREGVYGRRILELLSFAWWEAGLPWFGGGNKKGCKIKLYPGTIYLKEPASYKSTRGPMHKICALWGEDRGRGEVPQPGLHRLAVWEPLGDI